MTVRANRAKAERELAAMVAAVRAEREVGVRSTVGELLEAWYAIASTGWAPTTIRQTCRQPVAVPSEPRRRDFTLLSDGPTDRRSWGYFKPRFLSSTADRTQAARRLLSGSGVCCWLLECDRDVGTDADGAVEVE